MARPKGLSKEVIRIIRRLSSKGVKQADLASQFGISQSTICKIVNNYIHRDVDYLQICGSAQVKMGFKYGNS